MSESKMERLLEGKRAVVTGSSRGLGLAIAQALARDGARVLVTSRSADSVRTAVAAIQASGGVASGAEADLAAAGGPDRVVQAAVDALGGIDILVNNAGLFIWRKFLELSRDEWEQAVAVNLSAPFHLIQAAARIMVRQGQGGSVVNIASLHASVPEAEVAPQAATKAGLVALTASAAAALRAHDIRVNAICPGSIEPDSADRRSASPRQKVTQADIATMAAYLSSDLSRGITGSVINMPGNTRGILKI